MENWQAKATSYITAQSLNELLHPTHRLGHLTHTHPCELGATVAVICCNPRCEGLSLPRAFKLLPKEIILTAKVLSVKASQPKVINDSTKHVIIISAVVDRQRAIFPFPRSSDLPEQSNKK